MMSDDELQKALDGLTPEEVLYLLQIISDPTNQAMDNLWNFDYEEVPVPIEEFISNKDYLGSSFINEEGKSVIYPFWHKELSKVFDPNKDIYEVALSGSIGSGKSTVAVIMMAYMLYKLLCLRNPSSFYNLANKSKIALAFFNLSIDQVYGVAYSKLQTYLKESKWFLEHGQVYGRKGYETYYPGKDIRIVCGSRMEHFIGLDIFCLSGETLVRTEDGDIRIDELSRSLPKRVYDSRGVLTDNTVSSNLTKYTDELIEIEFDNGGVVRCTPDHKFLLKDGTYKEAMYLTEDDELFEYGGETTSDRDI